MNTQRFFRLSFILLSIISILLYPRSAFAQTAKSNCVTTKIGNPLGAPLLPLECQAPVLGGGGSPTGKCGTVLEWATRIADNLTYGRGYDQLNATISSDCSSTTPLSSRHVGRYWCTYLVIDSYNMAGITGLSIANGDSLVDIMHNHWRSMPGYFVLDYKGGPSKEVIAKVKPGYAIFYGYDDEHVGTVKSINYDERGNGTIETNESNSSAPSHKWPISEWKVINGFIIDGFGGYN